MTSRKTGKQQRLGIRGVQLKKFEEVVCDCIHGGLIPNYFPLPNLPNKAKSALIASGVEQYHTEPIPKQNDNSDSCDENTNSTTTIPPCPWPFSILPSAVNVRIDNSSATKRSNNNDDDNNNVTTLGKLSGMRAVRKEWQLRSMIQCLLAMLPSDALGPLSESDDKEEKIKIIDFAGGTGVLALPLAILLPKCEIVLVDLKATSLEIVHEKAKELSLLGPNSEFQLQEPEDRNRKNNSDEMEEKNQEFSKKKRHKNKRAKPKGASRDIDVTSHSNTIRQSKYITNLFTYHGSITKYAENNSFDIGLSLHCCGEGTDLVLQACGKAKAQFIVSPCCVGKLNSQKHNPYVYYSTSLNEPTVTYPQSSIFCKLIESRDKFDALAKAADYSDIQYIRTCRNASRRTAKALLELDRLLFMKEKYGFDEVVLTRMSPWEATPKNDILLGWFHDYEKSISGPYDDADGGFANISPCHDCNADIEIAINQLVSPINPKIQEVSVTLSDKLTSGNDVDWDKEEIDEYTAILQEFIVSDLVVKRFQTRMGSR